MGYESRIIVVHRIENEYPNGEKWVFGDEIARFDLCKMGYEHIDGVSFPGLFKTPIDFDLHNINEYDDPDKVYPERHYREDCYGVLCCSADIDSVMAWLEKSEAMREWWRAQLFYNFLKTLKESGLDNLTLVHYGH